MKREMFFATVFSAALAVGVAAQNPPSTAQTPSQDRQVTVTGCLAQAPSSSATGTSGTAGTSAGAAQYILKDATMGAGAAGSTGTSGTGASASAMGKSYKLIGGSADDFKSNVNAKVEIKGTLQPASGAPSSGTATTPPASGQSDKDLATLRVTSVRKIADTCSGQ